MRHFHKSTSPVLIAILIAVLVAGAVPGTSLAANQPPPSSDIWYDVDESGLRVAGERWIVPQSYRTVGLNVAALQDVLDAAPAEGTPAAATSEVVLELPLPEGGYGRFRIVESPVMAPELAAKFPEITTYAGQGLDDPTATTRFDWTPAGFHAIIFGLSGTVYIDPFSRDDTTTYISYYKNDFVPSADKRYVEIMPISADGDDEHALRAELAELVEQGLLPPTGSQLRTYRLAMAATGEYTAFHGGTVPLAMAAIVTSVNRVDGVYEREVAIRMVLVANNNLIVYTNSSTDPYTNNNGSTMLGQNQTNLDTVIGSANYDIGHVFSTGGGGVAVSGRGVPGQPEGARRHRLLGAGGRSVRHRLRGPRDGPSVRRQPQLQRQRRFVRRRQPQRTHRLRTRQRLDHHGLCRHLRRAGSAAAQRRLLPRRQPRRDRDLQQYRAAATAVRWSPRPATSLRPSAPAPAASPFRVRPPSR